MKSSKLKAFIERHFSNNSADENTIAHELHLACAALMFEMIRVDDVIEEAEEQKLLSIIKNHYMLDKIEINELIELAQDKIHNATDYFQFTSLLNEHYTQEQKQLLIKNLWELALSDNKIDKHEEHLVRNLAELLHVPHSAFMQLKHKAQASKT